MRKSDKILVSFGDEKCRHHMQLIGHKLCLFSSWNRGYRA